MHRLIATLAVLAALALPVAAQGMRTFTDDAGNTVEIALAPQRIVSLRGEQFTSALHELGAPVVASSGRVSEGVNDGRPYPRGAYDLFNLTFEDGGMAWIGNPNNPDLEAIAAADPDLILIPDWQTELYDQLSAIAPTVVVGIWGNPLLQRYRKVADAAGRLDAYAAMRAAYEAKLDKARAVVADRIGDPSQVSVAIAEVFDGELWVYRDYAALSQVIRDLGFSTPEFIAAIEGGNAQVSPELLPQIDADFLVGTYNVAFDQPPSARLAEFDALVPGWDEVLHAPRHDQHILLDRETMRGVSFRALETTLAILLSHIVTRDFTPLQEAP